MNIEGKIIQMGFYPPRGIMMIATNRAIYSFDGEHFILLATTDMIELPEK